jgi:hypothetical protein
MMKREREKYNRDEPNDSRDKWEKVGLKLEGYSLCSIESHTIARQDMEVLKDEERSESTKSDLDDMWYTRDKESNIQGFEDEDLIVNEDFKEEMNAYIIDGLHVPHDEMEGMQKGIKETPSLVEIGSPSTPLDEPNITLVEKALRPRYAPKSQDTIGIDVDKFNTHAQPIV